MPVPFNESVLVTREPGVCAREWSWGRRVRRRRRGRRRWVVGVVGVVGDRVAAGVVAGAVAVFRTCPASTSAWVIVWVAVQVAAAGGEAEWLDRVQTSDASASARESVT